MTNAWERPHRYEVGRKCAAALKKTMKIVFDEFLPKWNYTAVPERS